jgi:2-polyprenyl-6-methoxyphenol hydroxylase-like FAD-dependent oxidoreductase
LSTPDADVDVLIVGGGPVGLTARALLARWGVRTLLVEKYAKLSPFPRSRLVNVRSMEIFRALGIAGQVADRAFDAEWGRVRFRDTLLGPDFATEAMVGVAAPIPQSPALGAVTSQDRLEPTLLAAADTPVRFGAELVDLVEESDRVVAVLAEDGAQRRVQARYVLGADGANSTVRELACIGKTGPGTLGRQTMVVFDADLDQLRAEPAGVYFTTTGGFAPIYPEGGWFWSVTTPADLSDVDWAGLVANAIGADIAVKVERLQHWVVNAFVAERFATGRVLLAGDAAHAIPPLGGMGMNTGLADVHNLCWKLAGVLRRWAGPGLLTSYDAERRPVALATLRQAATNMRIMRDAQQARRDGAVALPWSDRYFDQLDQVLGYRYESAAVLSDGGRLPHAWLSEGRSTLDVVGEWFTLFTPDPRQWTGTWPVRVAALPGETLLVRPDGHIAQRWRSRPADDVLQVALSTVSS